MTHSPAVRNYREKQAGDLQIGDYLYLPGDGPAERISRIELICDDFGVPALLKVSTVDGGLARLAFNSSVPVGSSEPTDAPSDPDGASPDAPSDPAAPAVVVPPLPAAPPAASGPSESELALIPQPAGTPESVVQTAAAEFPDNNGVQVLGERLAKGINTKSGSCLRDLSDLAHDLFIVLRDTKHALAVADLLNLLPFDGNRDRWTSIERSLALSSFICRENGQEHRAEVYEKLLRAPESQETDPFRARINAKVRQRNLNEPNLYDKEIFRAIDHSNHNAERDWRLLRLESLLFLRAHGGSETIGTEELARRIGNELEAVRA